MTLRKLGLPFKIFDRTGAFFTGASSKNQNRLHLERLAQLILSAPNNPIADK
jgi:hypothetical protein